MRMLTGLLMVLAVYVPNQLHFPDNLGAKGLNVFNLLFLVTLIMLLAMRDSLREAGGAASLVKAPLRNMLLIYYAVLGFALLAGIAWGSPHAMADLTVYKSVVTYSMLYFVAFYGVRELRDARLLLGVILFVFAVASFEAIREGLDYGFGSYTDSQRAAGPFSADSKNANFAGVFYSVFSSFTLAIALFGKSLPRWMRLAAAGAFVLGVIAVLATFSRQSFLILGVTVLLLTLRKNPLLGVAALLMLLSYSLWAPEGVIERVEMTQEQNEYGETVLEDSAESRYVIWAAALDIIREHPEGIGLNQFKRVVDPYMPSWVIARDAQNQYLLIAAEAGIIGLVAFVALLAGLFIQGVKLTWNEHPPEAKAIGMAFSFAVIAVMLGNVYSSTFHHSEVMGNFWLLAGLVSRYRTFGPFGASAVMQARALSPLERARKVYARWQHQPPDKEPAGNTP